MKLDKCLGGIIALSIFSMPVSAYAMDSIHLKNGDKISGDIVAYMPGKVEIKTSYGTFGIPFKAVASIEGSKSSAAQEIISSNKVQNTPQSEPVSARVQTVAPEKVAEPTKVAVTTPVVPVQKAAPAAAHTTTAQKPPKAEKEQKELWGAKWSGNANLGLNWKTGNSKTRTISADTTVQARWKKYRTTVKAEYNRESDSGVTSVNNRALSVKHDYFFRKKWFWRNKAKFEQDSIQNLDLRTTLSSSIGYQPFERDDLSIDMSFGPGYINEKFKGASNNSNATVNWSFDYKQKFYNGLFSLFHNHDVVAPTDNLSAYILQTESGIRVPVRYGIVASGQINFDRNNQPVAGAVKDDTAYFIKFGYEW